MNVTNLSRGLQMCGKLGSTLICSSVYLSCFLFLFFWVFLARCFLGILVSDWLSSLAMSLTLKVSRIGQYGLTWSTSKVPLRTSVKPRLWRCSARNSTVSPPSMIRRPDRLWPSRKRSSNTLRSNIRIHHVPAKHAGPAGGVYWIALQ